jgi:membrane protein DedA with SNARE-associated domain
MIGLRTITPLVIGSSGYSARRFLILNSIGAVLWVFVFSFAGHVIGQILETLFGEIKKYELHIVLAIAMLGAAIWAYRSRALKHRQPVAQ